MHRLIDPPRVSDVADHACNRQVFKSVAQRLLNLIHRKLALLEQHQHRRLIARDLTAQLGTDRATRTRDHNDFIRDEIMETGVIENNRLPLHQILDCHTPEFGR